MESPTPGLNHSLCGQKGSLVSGTRVVTPSSSCNADQRVEPSPQSHTRTHTHIHSHSLTHSLTHSHSLSLTRTHTHTHTHTHRISSGQDALHYQSWSWGLQAGSQLECSMILQPQPRWTNFLRSAPCALTRTMQLSLTIYCLSVGENACLIPSN